jgi:hypothetical protein
MKIICGDDVLVMDYIAGMKVKIDTNTGREMITRRFATVEPVFLATCVA